MATALAPYRVLDLTNEGAWMCGKILADLGADVVKIDPPAAAARIDASHDPTWLFQNRGKRSITLDLDTPDGRAAFLGLVSGADAVVESQPTGWLDARGLAPDRLLATNPKLVVTSISPFGRTGPYAGYAATDLVVNAMCGLMWLTGDADRPPVRISAPQLMRHGGAEAAAQTLIALFHAGRSGQGQHVDVSAQLAGIRTLMNAQAFHLLEGAEINRMGDWVGYSRPRYRMVVPCADGYMAMLLAGSHLGGPMMRYLLDWADDEVGIDPEVKATDFFTINFAEIEGRGEAGARAFFDGIANAVGALFARHTKAELYQVAIEQLMLMAPITTLADLRADEQLADRGYFVSVAHDDAASVAPRRAARTITMPGRWARLAATPLRDTPRAPRLGEHTISVLNPAAPPRRPAAHGTETTTAPFEGLKVLDLSWVGVGPMTGGYLANYGATVVKVESSRRPDILRLSPPFRDGRLPAPEGNGRPGLNNSHFCANMNASKVGLGLDLGRPEAQELVRRLAGWADVVLESFTPKTLRAWGLDYPALAAVNPSLVMLSTCMQGQTGPRANYRGFGNLMGALSGFYHLTGWPDRGPNVIYGAYTDFICQRFCTAAVTAALDHRRRTGEGQLIDLAQFEGALQFLGPEFVAYDQSGVVPSRAGNRDPHRAPHGVFPCRNRADGSQAWIAVACETDAQWASLRDAAGLPDDPGLANLAGRKAGEDALEAALGAWTAQHDAWELFERLQHLTVAVPCGPVLSVPDLHTDPQIGHRGYWVPLDHTVQGTVPYDGLAATMSATPGRLTKAGPCLGEDSFEVLTEILGMSADQVADLLAAEVVEIT